MGKHQLRELARIIDYILYHRPDEFGLFPDEDGSLPVKELMWALHEEPGWTYVRPTHLKELAYSGLRVNFSVDDAHIRPEAPSPIRPTVTAPPRFLFHGARRQAYQAVLEHGLRPGGRGHVALASTEEMALRIGSRRDAKPVLLTVEAARAHEAGHQFLRCGELLYLVRELPALFLAGPPLDQVRPPAKAPRKSPEVAAPGVEQTPGSFLVDPSRFPGQNGAGRGKKDVDWKRQLRRERRRRKRDGFF
ncbi:MAG TPA: RNA 2'-phosphotransferase [Syntrophobacteria bacterium]|nr:RNA 2'-phosphotransferase [Syntrophobacteria bacterium]